MSYLKLKIMQKIKNDKFQFYKFLQKRKITKILKIKSNFFSFYRTDSGLITQSSGCSDGYSSPGSWSSGISSSPFASCAWKKACRWPSLQFLRLWVSCRVGMFLWLDTTKASHQCKSAVSPPSLFHNQSVYTKSKT